MLNWNTVLRYIKGRLALPSTFIEYDDNEIMEWLKITAIPEFSDYFPDVEYTSVLPANEYYRVPGKTNWYKFFDEEELDILGIKQCYFSLSNEIISGHPIIGPLSMEEMKCWSLSVFKSRFFMPFSEFKKTYIFHSPNYVQIFPSAQNENFVVEYEREQPHDLRKIPVPLKRLFMDLCLAEMKIRIGEVRSHYGDGRLQTPFGEIPLSGETLKSDGNKLKREVIEKLEMDSIPPVIIEIE